MELTVNGMGDERRKFHHIARWLCHVLQKVKSRHLDGRSDESLEEPSRYQSLMLRVMFATLKLVALHHFQRRFPSWTGSLALGKTLEALLLSLSPRLRPKPFRSIFFTYHAIPLKENTEFLLNIRIVRVAILRNLLHQIPETINRNTLLQITQYLAKWKQLPKLYPQE